MKYFKLVTLIIFYIFTISSDIKLWYLIEFIFSDKKTNEVKMLFDKNSLELRGWETNDAYSNKVNFEINNLIINNQIVDDFFKIPQEKDL